METVSGLILNWILVSIFLNQPFSAGLGALYWLLILHLLLALVHRTFVNAFKGTINLHLLYPG
jgi:hypothetical protein